MTVEAAAYNAEQAATQCLFSHKRTLAQNIVAGDVIDFSSLAGDERPPQPGRGLTFNGVDGTVVSASNIGISGDADFTFLAFCKPVSVSAFTAVSSAGYFSIPLNGVAIGMGVSDGGISLEFGGGNGARTASGVVSAGESFHLAATKTAGAINTTVSIYKNAVDVPLSTASTGTPNITNTPLNIARLINGSSYFPGDIWGVRVYNRALTQQEIEFIYNGGELSVANLMLSFPLAEGAGTTAYDVSGNGNHGTHSGGVTHAAFTDGAGSDTNNQHGYYLSSGVYVPLTPGSGYTLAADGNAPTVGGRTTYNATITGHDGTTNGFHSGCTLTFNPNGAPELAAYYGVTWVHGDPIPAGITADLGGDGVYRNIRIHYE